ncbi:hypothetical protein ANCCAN_06860, partial [Ancylostoma caninum]
KTTTTAPTKRETARTTTQEEIRIPFNEPTNATTTTQRITAVDVTERSLSTNITEAGLFTSNLQTDTSTVSLSILQKKKTTEEAKKDLMNRAALDLLVLSLCMTFVLISQLVFIKLMRTTRRRHYKFTAAQSSEQKQANSTTMTLLPMPQAASSSTVITTTTTLESIAVEKKQPQKAVQLSAEPIESKNATNEKIGSKRRGESSKKRQQLSQNQKPESNTQLKSLARTMKEDMKEEKTLDLYNPGANMKSLARTMEGEKTLDLYEHGAKKEQQKDGALGLNTQKNDDFFALPKR